MAYMITDGANSHTTIENFLGLNMSQSGDTQLKLGEASSMKNWRITKDRKLTKMNGYLVKYEGTESPIRAQWVGKLGENEVHVYVCGGKVYNQVIEIGTLTDDITNIFEFNKILYFINGHEYKKWDGTTFSDVEGYIPKIKIATTPEGIGTDYEPINLLSDKRHQTFSPDGEATAFLLAEQDLTSIDKVLVDGVETTVTKDLVNGKITFKNAPAQAVDNIDVYWTKTADNAQHILKNKYFQKYGLASDTRVFLYGNDDVKNRIYFSDLADGVPSVDYFPATNFIDVGSSNVAVTDISRQYDRLIISKENEAYYSSYEAITDSTGNTIITFPTYPLNSSHGMVAKGQGQLLDNYVTTIDTSIIQWTNTNTKDERNVEIISERIQEWLNERDLAKAITLDYQELKEYWVAIENEIMIYNYGNSTFYLAVLPHNVTSLTVHDGTVYMGTSLGKIMEFGENVTTYAGQKINAEWRSGFYDFEIEYKRKTMRILWIALKPWVRTSLKINYQSDRELGNDEKEIESSCYSYEMWNYSTFTYNTSYSIRPFRVKLKAKKFAYLELILSNSRIDEKVTVNTITIQKSYGGFVK